MKQYLLPQNGSFFKANLHIHTNLSDGAPTPEEVKKIYMEQGYSIVAYTDHEVIIPHNDLSDENFIAITSYELAINEKSDLPWKKVRTTHMNLYAKDKNNVVPPCFDESKIWIPRTREYVTDEMRANKFSFEYSAECINEIIAKANDAGFLVSYNHPVWSLQSREDYIDYKGLWAVECYNHECAKAGYVDTIVPVDDLLRQGERVFPIATDDSHRAENCCGGYVMVKAEKLEYGAVMEALEKGDFYASNGPSIKELTFEDGVLHIECSEALNIIVNTDRRIARNARADSGSYMTSRDIDLGEWVSETKLLPENVRKNAYFRVTVVGPNGEAAWSRAYFFDTLELQ